MAILLLLGLASAATLQSKVSPVQKVVELLVELKGKVEADLSADEQLMNDYNKYCDEEGNAREDAITSGQRTIGDLEAQIAEASATVATLTSEIEELAHKIATAEGDLKASTKIRTTEHADFAATEAELSETIDTLARATIVLKRGQTSFLQKDSDSLKNMADALKTIIDASWVSRHQKQQVQALLQAHTESQDQDEDLELQPQATSQAFTSQGGGILDTLADMKNKAEETLSTARKEEMEASHGFEMLRSSLEQEIGTMNKRKSAATAEKSANSEAQATAEEDLASTQNALATDQSFLKDLKLSCQERAAAWDERQKSAQGEIAAILKAKEILESGVRAFLQVSATVHMADDDSRRSEVADIFRKLASKGNHFALTQLASAAMSDPFGKIRGLIESMIDRLTKEAAQEADAKSFCDTETSKSKAKQASLTEKLDMHSARIEKGTANKAELEAQIKALEEAVAGMDAMQREATNQRQGEHEEFLKASADYKASAEAVANAIQVLSDYYAGASFIQLAATESPPEFGGAKSDVAGTIMSLLEVAESDFTKLLAEAEAEEASATKAYEKLTQENAVAKAAAQTEAKGKRAEVKQLETSLLNYQEDHTTTSKELDAVLSYLDKLKPQCETKVMSYAERKAKREEEIAGLKEALSILEDA